jgi:hypothetical protein
MITWYSVYFFPSLVMFARAFLHFAFDFRISPSCASHRFKMDVTEEEIKDAKEPKEVKSFRRSKGGKIGKTWDPLDG